MRHGKKGIAIILLFAFTILSGCQNFKEPSPTTTDSGGQTTIQDNYWPTDEWRTSTPEEQGMDSAKLADMLKYIESSTGIRSVQIIRHGYLVMESYQTPYKRDTMLNVKSVGKSVISALTGIAIREKYIDSIDQKVEEYLPEYFKNADPRKREIALRHLLTMTAGLPSIDGDVTDWSRSEDWVRHVIDLPLRHDPGTEFEYNTGLTHIMSAIISKTSGMDTSSFCRKYLFDAMGIKIQKWPKDPKGINIGGAEFYMTPFDMSKFGYLYLNNGKWNGQQLVPAEWVEESTKNQQKNHKGYEWSEPEYGYKWWIGKDYYCACGYGEQVVLVCPKLDMVAVFTGAENEPIPRRLFETHIIPSVESDATLKPNASAQKEIRKISDRMAGPKNASLKPPEEILRKINGRTYKCEENSWGLTSFTLLFDDSGCKLKYTEKARTPGPVPDKSEVKMSEYAGEVAVGLDGNYIIVPVESGQRFFKDIPRFPIYEMGGIDKYQAGFKGQWTRDNKFVLDWLIAVDEPTRHGAVFTFDGNKVEIRTTMRPGGTAKAYGVVSFLIKGETK